jgi:diacylglycerol kinase (ATP)
MKTGRKGLMRLLYAFKYSYEGFIAAFKSEEALRIESVAFVVGTVALFFIPVSIVEIILLFTGLFLVVFAEITNTAIEMVVDRISDDFHPLSKIAKDLGSFLVAFSIFYTVITWGLILWKNFI